MVYVLNMTSPDFDSIRDLYQKALSVGALEHFQKQGDIKIRRGVYSAQVVLWLMIVQRLFAGTLAATVQLLIAGVAGGLLQNCRRVNAKCISARTGGYCQARQKLPKLLCRQVNREITEQLRKMVAAKDASTERVYVLDGSTLELEASRELARHYPAARNQYSTGHWPILQIVVAHDVETGLAEEPQWGAMYGKNAVSEHELVVKMMDQLPARSALIIDRNGGVLWMAYEAQQRGLGVLLRLKKDRAEKLYGGPLSRATDCPVTWKASRWDGGKKRCVPAQTTITGRLVTVRIGRGKAKEWLYLFTTLDQPADKLAELYGRRWNIETDLRSLKRTVSLYHMSAKTLPMLEKELLMAMAAYNLVRAVMALAARQSGIHPRRLSFAHVLNVVNYGWPKLAAASTPQEFQQQFAETLRLAAQCTLPNRTRKRSYPRAIWRHNPGFPYRKSPKTK